jgi:sigma-B regulation protein RsbU (phosphoserine phosphatase)
MPIMSANPEQTTGSDKPVTQPAEKRIKVMMVDDQAIMGAAVRGVVNEEPDMEFHFCQDPSKALELAEKIRPTVILQDLVMPEVDGLMLVKFYRANANTRDIPLIVLSSKEEPVVKVEAFARGANDYLVKLPHKLELVARIRYHSDHYVHLLERNEAFRQLAESQRLLAQEVAQAARYAQSLLPEKLTGEVRADWRFIPSTSLGGDMFGYHWIDPDHLAIYLLDVSGHGVGSSLLAVSAMNVLAGQALPNTDFHNPSAVLKALNDTFKMEKQDGKYFTLWYGVYSRAKRELTFANAAHPPALLFNGPSAEHAAVQRLASQGLAIGVLEDYEYDISTVQLDRFARLLLYSDGVYEVAKPDGSMWKFEEFVQYITSLATSDGSIMDRLLEHVRQMHGAESLADDFSMVEIEFR